MTLFRQCLLLGFAVMLLMQGPQQAWAGSSVNELLSQGNQALVQQRYNKAAVYYQAIIEKQPEHLDALFGLATAYEGEGQSEKAMSLLTVLVSHHPEYAPAYLLMGEIAEKQDKVAEAKKHYQHYIDHSQGQLPKSPRLLIKFRRWGLI